MSQFDIHRNTGRNREAIPYVLVVQSSLFSRAQRRVVVPLVSVEILGRVAQLPASSVNPVFDVEGRPVVLNPLEIVSIPLDALGEHVGSLAAQGDVVVPGDAESSVCPLPPPFVDSAARAFAKSVEQE